MKALTPAILALSLLSLDATARSRVGVPAIDSAARPAEAHSIRALNEIAIAPVSDDPAIHQSNPVIASDGESFLILWRESTECCFWRDGQTTLGALHAMRVDHRGQPMDAEPTLLSSVATTSIPGVAFDGTNYLVVWNENGPLGARLVGQRLSRELTPLDVTPFVIRSPVPSPDMRIGLACGSEDCLTVFDHGHALISKNGGVLSLSLETGGLKNSVIPTDNGYAAMLTSSRPGQWGPTLAYNPIPLEANTFAQFSEEGTVTGPFPLASFSAHVSERIGSDLATDGSSIVIAGVDRAYENPREPPLYVIQVPANIASVPSAPRLHVDVGLIDGLQPIIRDPRIIWTGKRYLLVYQRSNESFGNPHRQPTKADIWGVWIDPNGSGTPGPAFDLTASDEFESLPAIAVNDRGLIALSFVRGRGGEGSPNPRLFVKTLSVGGGRSRPVRR